MTDAAIEEQTAGFPLPLSLSLLHSFRRDVGIDHTFALRFIRIANFGFIPGLLGSLGWATRVYKLL